MNNKQVEELVLQSLEHELGGVKVYATALECAVNADLKKEWKKYLAETKTHVARSRRCARRSASTRARRRPGATWCGTSAPRSSRP